MATGDGIFYHKLEPVPGPKSPAHIVQVPCGAPIADPLTQVATPVLIQRAPALGEPNPSLLTKAQRLRKELGQWLKAGAPMAPRGLRKARMAACNACELWDAQGNLGMGQCRAPGCGCTKAKTALLTSYCPHPKGSRWPVTPAH